MADTKQFTEETDVLKQFMELLSQQNMKEQSQDFMGIFWYVAGMQMQDIYLNFIGAFEVPEYIVTPSEVEEQRHQREEQEAEEKRLAHNREWQKEWREKRKAAEPPKPPKQKSIKELMEIEKTGADITPEETERLAAYRRKKADQQKARREKMKTDQRKTKAS